MKKVAFIASMLLAVFLFTTGCGGQNTVQNKAQSSGQGQPASGSTASRAPFEIKMGSGPAGAVTDALYAAVFDDLKKAHPYITGGPTTGAPDANIVGLSQKKYNIAHSLTDITGAAEEGQEFFAKTGPIIGLYNLIDWWPNVTTWVVWADSPYKNIQDLKGKKISVGPRGGSNDLETRRILEALGMSYKDFDVQYLGFDDAQEQMLDGHLDALLYSMTAYPHSGLLSVIAQKQVRFLPVPEDALNAVVNNYKGLARGVLPAGVYKLKDGSPSPEMPGVTGYIHWLVGKDFPDDVAYDIVKTITENFDRYKANFNNLKWMKVEDLAREVPGIPMQPGAKKYFVEKGFIK